jgi:adenine-specific DNA methylase
MSSYESKSRVYKLWIWKIKQPDLGRWLARIDLSSLGNIRSRERLEPVRIALDFVQERQLLLVPDLCLEQVVEFGQSRLLGQEVGSPCRTSVRARAATTLGTIPAIG